MDCVLLGTECADCLDLAHANAPGEVLGGADGRHPDCEVVSL